jgi:hypothetical protein
MSGQKTTDGDPIRSLVATHFPKARIVDEKVAPFLPDVKNPLEPDLETPRTRHLYSKFFGLSDLKTDAAAAETSSEDALSEREGRVLIERPASPGKPAIKEQVLVSGGKIVAFSDSSDE